MAVERPASVAEVCDVVRRCAADGTAIYPVGGGTLLDYGTPPARPGIALSTAKLDQVIDFPARDMTITVQAGITIARLNEMIKAERLWLPIDVPNPETATLGGSIAANVSGPRRYGYGTLRDYVIGITLVNDRGEETKAGGRVVKNVAGYDLMKLYTGSLGTLGVITQVTLKLKPRPEDRAIVVFGCADDQLHTFVDLLHSSATRPVHVDLTDGNPDLSKDNSPYWCFNVGFDGSVDAVAWQLRQIFSELRDAGIAEESISWRPAPEAAATLSLLSRFPWTPVGGILRVTTRPAGVVELCRVAAKGISGISVLSHVGNGVISLGWPESLSIDDLRPVHTKLMAAAERLGGNVVTARCPTEWKKTLPVWGRPPADLTLQKAVKRALDPEGIFNLGRFVTG